MDEIWIHHFTLESNQQSAEWTAEGESCPKQPKMQTSAGKVLASIFWDVQGIFFINYLKKGRTITNKYYIALLVHLKEEIAKKQPQMKKKKCSFTKSQLNCNNGKTTWIALLHPPYSPDLAPSDYWLFADLKRMFQGKTFGSNEEVISETEAYLEVKDKSFYKKHRIVREAWNQCITIEGNYVDEQSCILPKSCSFIS